MVRRPACLEPIALPLRRGRVNGEDFVRAFEIGIVAKQRLEMGDPVAARAGLTVGNAPDQRTKQAAHGFEHFGGARQRHASDEIDATTWHETPFSVLRDRNRGLACAVRARDNDRTIARGADRS